MNSRSSLLQPEPTQQELVMRASQEAGFSKTIGLGQFFRTRPRCNNEGKWIALPCKGFTKPRSIDGSRTVKVIPERTQIGPVLDVLVSEDQGIKCMEMIVPSPSKVASTAWIRISRGATQWARTSSEIAPGFERTDCVFMTGGTAVAQAQLEDTRICADQLRSILKSQCHHRPTDCTRASQIPPSRASGDRLLSGHHPCSGKTHRNHLKFASVKDVGVYWDAAKEKFARTEDDPQRVHESSKMSPF